MAAAPIEIANEALGYNIKYTIDSFTYEYNTGVTLYTGYPLFEEMQTADTVKQNLWAANRAKAYKGSMLHFMRSLYNKQLKDEGFEIQFLVKSDDKEEAVPLLNFYGAMNYNKDDSTKTVEVKPTPQRKQETVATQKPATKESKTTLADNFQKITRIRSAPNEKFAYSNPGYLLLGRVIEKASGLPYRRYIEQHILEPLGVQNRLGFERQQHWNIATGYHKTFSVGNLLLGILLDKKRFMGESTEGWKSFLPFYINGSAYGGLLGTPGAYIIFAQHLLKNESRLLSQAGRQEMWRENTLLNGKSAGMSLGWFKGNLDGRAYACHAGGGGGFYCEIRVYTESGLGSVVFMNRSGFSDERFLDKADAILLADDAG